MFDYKLPCEDTISAPLPKMLPVQQSFEDKTLEDVSAAVQAELARGDIASLIVPGASIAVGVGSRGINNLAEIVITLIAEIKKLGAEPFIFPAMGSHGSATAEGQIEVLADLGINEEITGVEIKSSLDTVILGRISDGTPVHIDTYAADADGFILVNRIKPHTTYRGRIGSGITKMMVVGAGKIAGATVAHDHNVKDFLPVVEEMAAYIQSKKPFLFGLGIVENAYDKTAHIEAIPSDTLAVREAELQQTSLENMGKLYFDNIDVLVVDYMGKDISGSGIDPNITGRNMRGVDGFGVPSVSKIVVLDLTEKTHGNAAGIGLVDVIPRCLFDKIDFAALYANVIPAGFLDGGQIPMIISTSRKAVMLAVQTVAGKKPEDVRVVRIRDTLNIENILVSESMVNDVTEHPGLNAVGEFEDWTFQDEMRATE